MRLPKFAGLLAALAFAAAAVPAAAQGGPPLRVLVGFAAGGSSDGVARVLADKLRDQLQRTVVVENKPGAIGMLAVKDAIASGAERPSYLVLPFSSLVFPVLTQPGGGVDIFRDLRPVASLTSFPLGVVVSGASGVRTPKEFAAWLKADPKRGQFGTAGAGGHNHFVGLQLGRAIGVEYNVVPYKGNAPLLTDLIPGHLPSGLMVAGEVTPHVKSGALTLVGVLTPQRSPLLPDTPTFAEQGIPVESGEAWYGMWTSAAVPKAEADKVEEALRVVLAMPEVRDAMVSKYAMQAEFRSAEQTGQRLKAAFELWAPVIKASGFKAE